MGTHTDTITPLERTIDSLQDQDQGFWIFGWNDAGSHALVMGPVDVYVASAHTCSGPGRWETTRRNFDTSVYLPRFPHRDRPAR